jgi:hypothetical protein
MTPAFEAPADPPTTAGPLSNGQLHVSFPCASPLSKLWAALSPATRLVAVTHVSNLLGGAMDLPKVVALVREVAPRWGWRGTRGGGEGRARSVLLWGG